jgi:signal peptidase II
MTEVEPAADSGPPVAEQAGRRRLRRLSPLTLGVAAVVIVLDQLTKHWAVNALADGAARPVFWTLQWNLTFNSGMAFSRGEGLGPFIAVVAVAVIITLVVTTAQVSGRLGQVAAGMLIGGAFGNLIDRAFRGDGWLHGSVVDFIDVQWWPIFNIADIGVTVGAILFALAAVVDPGTRKSAS